jgi:hypothetical protein
MVDGAIAGILEVVVFVGGTTISSKMKAQDLSNVLDAVERGRGISPEMRDDEHYQMQNRMHTYSLIMSEGFRDDFIPVVVSDVLWLTLNHFAAGDWVTETLVETLKAHEYAVLSVSIGHPRDGRVDGTGWGITIANTPADVRDRLDGLLFVHYDITGNTLIDFGASREMLN